MFLWNNPKPNFSSTFILAKTTTPTKLSGFLATTLLRVLAIAFEPPRVLPISITETHGVLHSPIIKETFTTPTNPRTGRQTGPACPQCRPSSNLRCLYGSRRHRLADCRRLELRRLTRRASRCQWQRQPPFSQFWTLKCAKRCSTQLLLKRIGKHTT